MVLLGTSNFDYREINYFVHSSNIYYVLHTRQEGTEPSRPHSSLKDSWSEGETGRVFTVENVQ